MYEFHTPEPVRLRLELGSGEIRIATTETDRTTVEVTSQRDNEAGREAVAETRVEQRGRDIVIEAPRKSASFFRSGPQLQVHVRVPHASQLEAKIHSADLEVTGQLIDVNVKTGSGDVRLDTAIEDTNVQSGSGDIELERGGRETRTQSGSGDVRIRHADGSVKVSTGSGDIGVDHAGGPVHLNSGSGDVQLADAAADVSVNTASGDQYLGRVRRGRVRSNAASGDIHIGVAEGTAAWLSVNSLSGSVHSELDGAEPPNDDEDTVEVRVNTVSGDITLVRS
ncbi:MAG: DUF4097 domain-containing protein [Actinomycetota bacterium]|nr:DUF4097 domain-containing protein [Actinomycetota bacterium]